MTARLRLPLVFLAALVVRVVYLAGIAGTPLTEVLLIDSETYDRLARRILAGDFRGEEVYSMNILYPYFLAAVYRLSESSLPAVLGVQAVLDALNVTFVFWIGRRVFGPAVGWTAAAIASLYAPMVFYTGALLTPVIITFFCLATLVLLYLYADRPRLWLAAAAGLAIGLATLGRGNNILFAAMAPLFFWRASADRRTALRDSIVLGLGALLVVGAITFRNYLVEGRVVPVAANYAAFYIGHNPDATGLYVLPSFTEGASFEAEVWGTQEAISRKLGRDVTLAESSRYLFDEGLKYAASHPAEDLGVTWRKFRYFWNRTESPTNVNFYFARDFSAWLRALPFHFGWIAPLGLAGMFLALRRRDVLLLYLSAAVPFVTCLLFFVSAEYRMPAAPVLIVFASFAVVALARTILLMFRKRGPAARTKKGRPAGASTTEPGRPRLAIVALALPLLIVFCNRQDTLLRSQTLRRVDYLNFGTLYKNRNEPDKARAMLARSLEIDPRYGPAYASLADLYRREGNPAEADRLAREARKYQLGGQYERPAAVADSLAVPLALYRQGDYPSALRGFRALHASAEASGDAALATSLLNNIGLCHYKMKEYEQAGDVFSAILEKDPTYLNAHNNLARVLAATGDVDGAVARLRAVLEIDPDNASALRQLNRLQPGR